MKKYESGQTSILLALSMIVLLAIVGFALNGGMLYFLQRDGQNTVDAGAMSGGKEACEGTDIVSAVMSLVEANRPQGEYQPHPLEDKLSDDGTYVIHSTEIVARDITTISWWSEPLDNTVFVRVKMVAREGAIFPWYIVDKGLENTVGAVAKCWLNPMPYNTVIMGVATECNDSVTIDGSTNRINGNPYSGSDLRMTSSDSVVTGQAEVVGTAQINPWVRFIPETGNPAKVSPYTGGAPVSLEDFGPGSKIASDAEAKGEYHYFDKSVHIVAAGSGDPVPISGGLYYVDNGGDFSITGSKWYFTGPVTIVAEGGISFSANAVEMNPYVIDPKVGGILLYSDKVTGCGPNAISVSTADANWKGGVVAPNGGVAFSSSNNIGDGWIYGQTVKVSGSNFTLNDTRPSREFDHLLLPVE